jgi:predicted MFS family arabinose efflux permease
MLQVIFARYRAAYSGLPREVWLLSLVLFVNRSGTMVMPFLTLYLTSQLEMSEAAAGRMIGLYGIGAITGAYLGGRLCQRFGAIRVQTVGLFLAAPAFLLLGVWDTWQPMAASLLLLSLVNEMVRPANATAVTQLSTPTNRTRAFSLNRLAANLGFSFGPAIGGVLADIDFGLLFIVDAATTLLAALVLVHFFGMRRLKNRAEDGQTATSPVIRPAPLRDGPFVAFLVLTTLAMMAFMQFGATYPLYLRDRFGMGKPQIGLMFAVNTSIIVVVEMLLIDAVKHWRLMRTIAWGSLLFCVGFGILPFGATGLYAVFAMTVVTIGEMLSFPMSSSFVANRGRAGSEAAYMGWYLVAHAIAAVLGPTVGAAIYQANRDALWYAILGVGVVLLLGYQLLARRVGDQPCEAVETHAATLPPPAELALEQLPLEPLPQQSA